MPGLGIFELKFEKNIVIFEISTHELVLLHNFAEKNYLDLGLKMLYLDIFGLELKTIVIFEIRNLKFV